MRCPLCSNEKGLKPLSPVICKSNNYLCERCGLVFIPRSSQRVLKYYKEDGYFKKSPNMAYKKQFISKSLLIKESEARLSNTLKIFPVNLEKKKVLDIGCGYGEILYVLKKKYKCEVEGIEASGEAADLGSKIFSIPIHPTLLEEFVPKKKFDIVWCSHVLEHTSNPSEFLKKITSLLKDQGYLYIEVPNILEPSGGFSLDMFLYKEHLQTFSVYDLYLILERNGFAVAGYSDLYFLKFWCILSSKPGLKPPKITSAQVLGFLQKYKDEYNLLSFAKVYAQKMLYATKLACYKMYDLMR